MEHTRPVKGRQAFRAAPLNGTRTPSKHAFDSYAEVSCSKAPQVRCDAQRGQVAAPGRRDRSQKPFCQVRPVLFQSSWVPGSPSSHHLGSHTPGLGCRHEDPCSLHVRIYHWTSDAIRRTELSTHTHTRLPDGCWTESAVGW